MTHTDCTSLHSSRCQLLPAVPSCSATNPADERFSCACCPGTRCGGWRWEPGCGAGRGQRSERVHGGAEAHGGRPVDRAHATAAVRRSTTPNRTHVQVGWCIRVAQVWHTRGTSVAHVIVTCPCFPTCRCRLCMCCINLIVFEQLPVHIGHCVWAGRAVAIEPTPTTPSPGLPCS